MRRKPSAFLRRHVAAVVLAAIPVQTGLSQSFELVAENRNPELHVAFSPDGRLYATIGECCGPVLLWETATGRLIRELRVPGNAHGDVVFSPDGRFVAATAVSLKSPVNGPRWTEPPLVWNVLDGTLLTKLPATTSEINAWGVVTDSAAQRRLAALPDSLVALSADGRTAVRLVGDVQNRMLSIRSVSSGIERRLPGTFNTLWALALSPDARYLILGSRPDSLDVWDLTSVQRLTTINQRGLTNALAFSRDGTLLALGDYKAASVYRTESWSVARTFVTDTEPSYGNRDVAFSRDGRVLAVSGDKLHIFDLTTGAELPRPGMKVAGIDAWANGAGVIAVARSMKPRPRWATQDATVELWSLGDSSPRVIGSQLFDVASLAVSPDGRQVAAGLMAATVWSRYTNAFEGGYWFWDGAGVVVPAASTRDATHEPVRDVVFSRTGKSLIGTSFVPIPTKRTCAYVACGEDEFTEYNVWLTRVDPRTGKESPIVWLAESGELGPDVTLSDHGEQALVRQRTGLRFLNGSTGRRVSRVPKATDSLDVGYPACDESERVPANRFSPSGMLAVVTQRSRAFVVRPMTGEIGRRLTFESDTTFAGLVSARFEGDTSIVLLTCKHDAGSALRRVDLRSGKSRLIATFDHRAEDFLQLGDGSFATHSDGLIRVYGANGEQRASLLFGVNGEWLVVTPDGRYDASTNGTALAAWRSGATLTRIEQRVGARRVPSLLRQLLAR